MVFLTAICSCPLTPCVYRPSFFGRRRCSFSTPFSVSDSAPLTRMTSPMGAFNTMAQRRDHLRFVAAWRQYLHSALQHNIRVKEHGRLPETVSKKIPLARTVPIFEIPHSS